MGIKGITHPWRRRQRRVFGVNTLNLDAKGVWRFRPSTGEALAECCASRVAVTLNPVSRDKCLWLYPENEWRDVAQAVPACRRWMASRRRSSGLILGHAPNSNWTARAGSCCRTSCAAYAGLGKRVALVGQVNKFEIWDVDAWEGNRDRWLGEVADDAAGLTEQLGEITL